MLLSEFMVDKELFGSLQDVEMIFFMADTNQEYADLLDLVLIAEYGQRTMFTGYLNFSNEQIAKILVSKFKVAWNNYYHLELLNEKLDSKREQSTVIDSTENRTGMKEDVDKITGFNSTSFIDDKGTNSQSSDEVLVVKTNTVVDTSFDAEKDFNMLTMLSKNNIIDKVMVDIINTLTINIY
jgi:hypothetical protein